METLQAVIGKRDSEFTGLKGMILRYVGNVYTLVLVGLFFLAFAQAYPGAALPLRICAGISFVLAVIIKPLKMWWQGRHNVDGAQG